MLSSRYVSTRRYPVDQAKADVFECLTGMGFHTFCFEVLLSDVSIGNSYNGPGALLACAAQA